MRLSPSRRLAWRGAAFAAALGLVGAAVAPAVAAPARAAASRPVYGGTLNLATQGNPPYLDVARAGDGISIQFSVLSYNTLVTYAVDTPTIVPSLATHWTITDGGRTYTFQIRKGVTFSNGDPLTAQDVVFTFTRLNEAATAAPYQGSFADLVGSAALFAGKAKTLSGIRAVGRYTVVMHLIQPERYWLNVLALPSAGIEDAAVAANWNREESGKNARPILPVGTGPFILKNPGPSPTEYVYVRNPHYWQKGLPYLNRVVFHIGSNPDLQFEQFTRGQLQALPSILLALNLDSSTYLQVRRSPTLEKEYWNIPSAGTFYLGMNPNMKPWNQLKLRQAVEYAINKAYVNAVLNNGRAKLAYSFLPPGIPGYEPHYNPYPGAGTPSGLRKARALVKAAGYPHGVNVGTFYVPEITGAADMASIVKTELRSVGIFCTPRLIGLGAYFNLVSKPNRVPFYYLQWGQDYPDPQDFMYNLFDGAQVGLDNEDYLNVPAINALLAKADASLNEPYRVRLYDQVQHLVMANAYVVPTTYSWADGLIGANAYPKDPHVWSNPAPGYVQVWRVWLKPGA
jgi:ABC-type transport system substrate-binding protein